MLGLLCGDSQAISGYQKPCPGAITRWQSHAGQFPSRRAAVIAFDLDVSAYKEGVETLDHAAARAFDHVLAAAHGELQAAERSGHWEAAFPIRGVTF
jgi:hypothetical protein